MSVCHKVKPDGSVFDTDEAHPQGSRQDFTQMEVVKEAYHDATGCVHGP